MKAPAALGVGGLPIGADGEVELAVAVHVVGRDADVVFLGGAVQDHVLGPGRILEPDRLRWIDRDDIGLAVAVDVGRQHRIDNAEVVLNFLRAELWSGARGRGEREESSPGVHESFISDGPASADFVTAVLGEQAASGAIAKAAGFFSSFLCSLEESASDLRGHAASAGAAGAASGSGEGRIGFVLESASSTIFSILCFRLVM